MLSKIHLHTLMLLLAFGVFITPYAASMEKIEKISAFLRAKKATDDADALKQQKKLEEEEAAKAKEAEKIKAEEAKKAREQALSADAASKAKEALGSKADTTAGKFLVGKAGVLGEKAGGVAYRAGTAKEVLTSQKEKDAVDKAQTTLDNLKKAQQAETDLVKKAALGKQIVAAEDTLKKAKSDLTKAQLKVGGGVAAGIGGIALIGGGIGGIVGGMMSGQGTDAAGAAGASGGTTTTAPTPGVTTVGIIGDTGEITDSSVYTEAIEDVDEEPSEELVTEGIETDDEIVGSGEEPESVFTVEGGESEDDVAFTVEDSQTTEEKFIGEEEE